MTGKTESRTLYKICDELSKARKITQKQRKQLSNLLGTRFDNALDVVDQNRVKQYIFEPSERRVWIVVGKSRDYEILPKARFCACDDYYFRVISGKTTLCYHLIAQKLAEALGKFTLIKESDEMYDTLMNEWKSAF